MQDTRLESNQKRLLKTYCDGGFGNRLNGLLTGMVIAELYDMALEVIWPKNNWCGASFHDIFENLMNVAERELKTYVPERGAYHYLMTEDHLQQGVSFISPLSIKTLEELGQTTHSSNKPIFLHTPLIPSYLPTDLIYKSINKLHFNEEYSARTEQFLEKNTLDNFYGIQIRKTDFGPHGADDKNLFELIQAAPAHRFFVCSDDREIEEKFKQLPNVVIYPKEAYVEKMKSGDWLDLTADFSGRVYPCNINRNEASVRDAIVDLMILSHSQIVRTSGSTFLSAALLLKAARVSAQQQ